MNTRLNKEVIVFINIFFSIVSAVFFFIVLFFVVSIHEMITPYTILLLMALLFNAVLLIYSTKSLESKVKRGTVPCLISSTYTLIMLIAGQLIFGFSVFATIACLIFININYHIIKYKEQFYKNAGKY